jgi:PAS domain S-box-containing protein
LELFLLIGSQVILSFFLFGGWLPERLAEQVLYLPMILLIWCTLRFELLEVTAGTALFATAAILGTWAGLGAYGSRTSYESLFDLQALLLTYAITSLIVSSIVAGRRAARTSSQKSQAELQRQTAERRRLETWFRQLLVASPDALIVSDSEGKILLVNQAAEKLFGYRSSEMVGQPVEILVPTPHRQIHREHRNRYSKSPYLRLMGTGTELVACRKDGSEFAAEIALGPTETDEGLVIFSAVRDITSRKKAEKALRDSEERFALAIAGTDAGIWDWDLRTDEVYFSPRWKSMLGYAEDEIPNEFSEWETRLHPDDRERALQTVHDYLEGKSAEFELEHRLRHKDGTYRWILARGAVVRESSGKPYRMAGSHLDITDRRNMEEKLRLHLANLIAAEEMQSHLLPQDSPVIPGFDIAGRCYPAEFAAGDHYDFLCLGDGTLVTLIGDVSGHGVGPAMLMTFLHAHLRSLASTHTSLSELILQANNFLERECPEDNFVTLLALSCDFQARTLSYVGCGHPPGLIMNADGTVSAWLDEGSLPLGIEPDIEFPCSAPIKLHSGDVVVLMTDGILEAESPTGDQFGINRVVQVISEQRHQSSAEIIEALKKAVMDYTGRDELLDDLTLVVIKVE